MYESDRYTKRRYQAPTPYVVFLDIDGVLTTARHYHALNAQNPGSWGSFDPVAIQFFNKLADTYDVDFVMSSTWRVLFDEAQTTDGGWITIEDKEFGDGPIPHWAEACFRTAGFKGKFPLDWRTPQLKSGNRAEEVDMWLGRHPEVEDYLIFDDIDFGFNDVLSKRRFIQTDENNGLLWKHMIKAESLVGQWNKK